MTRKRASDPAKDGPETRTSRKQIKIILGGLFIMALCGVARYYWGAAPASADPSARSDAAAGRSARPSSDDRAGRDDQRTARPSNADDSQDSSIPDIVATVNTQRIGRDELANQCVRHFGKEVLQALVNKRLIVLACRQAGVKVTRGEVKAEIERMAKQFKVPVDQWMKLIQQQKNVTPEQYANEIVWPMIAMRKLAGDKVTVSEQEIRDEFETQYGEQVKVRLIAVKDSGTAESLRAKAMADPGNFGNLAKKYSEDPSASVKGIINPIRRHGSYEQIEKVVFNMKDGSISPVIEARGQYLVFQRIGSNPKQNVDFDEAAPRLRAFLRDRKTQRDGQEVFKELQERAVKQKAVQIVFNDPAGRQKLPGVAALVYDTEISMRELADDCLARHAQEVLDGVIGHKVVELECKKRGISVTEKDIDREIARAAMMGVTAKKDGSPDVDAWLKLIRKRGISLDVYRHDLVWTSVALKKLVGDNIKITEDDLQKGYEANYGERVRCLAIVLNDQRRAQQVWEMARKNNTSEYFGKLAGQYSVEPGSQSLSGEVPPIRRYGGQKLLEDEAFQLKPGELSGVIQVNDKFIVLRCEGRTKPLGFEFAKVRDEIYDELHEKKLQIAMQDRFDALQEAATIDNYLAGTSHSPKPTAMSPTARRPNLQRTPTQ